METPYKIKYIDLFCGLGAFHEAFNTSELMECVFASDINKGIQTVYKSNYNMDIHGDICEIDTLHIPDFDILCAGFPCQPFSIAGNGKGFQDEEKGNLFYHILRIIDTKQPLMCILENVKNLKSHDNGTTYKIIENELTNRGYHVKSKILNAIDFGSPQARQRIFIVATKNTPFLIPNGTSPIRPVSSIIDTEYVCDDLNYDKYTLHEKQSIIRTLNKPKLLYDVYSKTTYTGGRQGERVYDPNHVGITICASSGGPGAKTGLYKIGSTIRRLSVKETLGMFGFPQTYEFGHISDEQSLFYLGNSIVVDVIKSFIQPIHSWFDNDRKK